MRSITERKFFVNRTWKTDAEHLLCIVDLQASIDAVTIYEHDIDCAVWILRQMHHVFLSEILAAVIMQPLDQ